MWSALRSPRRLRDLWRLIVEIVLFGLASAGLFVTGHQVLAGLLFLAFAVTRALLLVWPEPQPN